jgi:D-alanine-D-alanine ligase
MKIGLTYDLRQDYLDSGLGVEETAEFDQEETIEALETTLGEPGHRTERIGHVKELVARLAGGIHGRGWMQQPWSLDGVSLMRSPELVQ